MLKYLVLYIIYKCILYTTEIYFIKNFYKYFIYLYIARGFPGGSEFKVSACNSGDPGLILGLGRSPGEGNGNPLQYSCLENPMNGRAWWATVRGVTESDTTERLHALTHMQPARLLCPWDFPGKNTRVGCHFFLQWIFLTHGSNLCLLHLLHWQACSLQLAPPGKPIYCALY